MNTYIIGGQGSSVSIVTNWRLDSRGVWTPVGLIFAGPIQAVPDAHPAAFTVANGVSFLGYGADHPRPSRTSLSISRDIPLIMFCACLACLASLYLSTRINTLLLSLIILLLANNLCTLMSNAEGDGFFQHYHTLYVQHLAKTTAWQILSNAFTFFKPIYYI